MPVFTNCNMIHFLAAAVCVLLWHVKMVPLHYNAHVRTSYTENESYKQMNCLLANQYHKMIRVYSSIHNLKECFMCLLPATCVRICMLFCSAASGSLYSPAFPVSTSSSFTFTWFRRSRNNLQTLLTLLLTSSSFHLSAFSLYSPEGQRDSENWPRPSVHLCNLLLFQLLKLFLQIQHLIETFSSPPLTVLIIHLFRDTGGKWLIRTPKWSDLRWCWHQSI